MYSNIDKRVRKLNESFVKIIDIYGIHILFGLLRYLKYKQNFITCDQCQFEPPK